MPYKAANIVKEVPKCSIELPMQLEKALRRLAAIWAQSKDRPRPSDAIVAKWDRLIKQWINETDLPLFVRKHRDDRGKPIKHKSGRILVPADNSPAHWVLSFAFKEHCPSIGKLREVISKKEIPVAMILKGVERNKRHFQKERRSSEVHQAGWKICHIVPVGLKTQGDIATLEISKIEEHFRMFMSPSNMFVVPLKRKALGELPEMIDAIKNGN